MTQEKNQDIKAKMHAVLSRKMASKLVQKSDLDQNLKKNINQTMLITFPILITIP